MVLFAIYRAILRRERSGTTGATGAD